MATEGQLPATYRRCVPCGKTIFPLRSMAISSAVNQRLSNGLYLSEYRCPRSANGGWHLRDMKKRLSKIHDKPGRERDELLAAIKRLDLLFAADADKKKPKQRKRFSLEDALRKLPQHRQEHPGRRRAFRRPRRDSLQDGATRVRGTRGTSVNNELRRRRDRARLREELRKEKDE